MESAEGVVEDGVGRREFAFGGRGRVRGGEEWDAGAGVGVGRGRGREGKHGVGGRHLEIWCRKRRGNGPKCFVFWLFESVLQGLLSEAIECTQNFVFRNFLTLG